MKYLITYSALIEGKKSAREALIDSETREQAVKQIFDDFFSSNPEGKVRLEAAVEVIDARGKVSGGNYPML